MKTPAAECGKKGLYIRRDNPEAAHHGAAWRRRGGGAVDVRAAAVPPSSKARVRGRAFAVANGNGSEARQSWSFRVENALVEEV